MEKLCSNIHQSSDILEVGVVGKYVELPDSYLSVNEAIKHAAANNSTKINIETGSIQILYQMRIKINI